MPSTKRPATKQQAVLQELRRQILDGRFPSGSRLPTRRELEQAFKTSLITIQHVMTQLEREGVIESRGQRGTFVAEHPPYLKNYAVIFPCLPDEPEWSRFWTAFANEATRLNHNGSRNIRIVYGVDGHEDSEGQQSLLRDLNGHRFAGLIFAATPYLLRGSPLLEQPGIPRVAVMSHANPEFPDVRAVCHDPKSFVDKALGFLASRSRRRLAIITANNYQEREGQEFLPALAAAGMETRPHWCLGVGRESAKFARNIAHLLMRQAAEERPDALVITDDNLVEYVKAGLIDAGVRVPDDLDVVAHCNFPWPAASVLPVRRLGYDARECLRDCLNIIDGLRLGQPVDPVLSVPARFEDELLEPAIESAEAMEMSGR